jgi:formylglycine-generating enzyme required for sulfatase activity
MTWGKPGHDRHPINCVSYVDAERYCAWAGKRLPTGAEWEVALRGPAMTTFPWGDGLPTLGAANGCDHSCATVARAATGFDYEAVWSDKSFDDGWPMTAPVGSFPGDVSGYGVLDLAGNLAEWTNPVGEADIGGSVAYAPKVPLGDRQLRGGSWATNVFSTMSFAGRDVVDGSFRGGWVGFRCAKGP